MTDASKRAKVADGLRRLLNTSAICIQPYAESVAEFVNLIIDTAKDELRAELDAGDTARTTDDEAWAFIRGDDATQGDAAGREPCRCEQDMVPTCNGKTCDACGGTLPDIAPLSAVELNESLSAIRSDLSDPDKSLAANAARTYIGIDRLRAKLSPHAHIERANREQGYSWFARSRGDAARPVPHDAPADPCRCSEPLAYYVGRGPESGLLYCGKCGKDIDRSSRCKAIKARPAPETPGVTCQCREPEAYSDADLGAIICNQCGYKLTGEDERVKLPPRAPKRDFGPHLCLCVNPGFPPMATDFTRCGTCKGSLWWPDQEASPGVMCG